MSSRRAIAFVFFSLGSWLALSDQTLERPTLPFSLRPPLALRANPCHTDRYERQKGGINYASTDVILYKCILFSDLRSAQRFQLGQWNDCAARQYAPIIKLTLIIKIIKNYDCSFNARHKIIGRWWLLITSLENIAASYLLHYRNYPDWFV